MTFSARSRAVGGAPYSDPTPLHSGAPGELRTAPLNRKRFLVLLRSGGRLRSRGKRRYPGFAAPLVFSGTDASRLAGLAVAPSGLGPAVWMTTSGRVQAPVYDDPLNPASLPGRGARHCRACAVAAIGIASTLRRPPGASREGTEHAHPLAAERAGPGDVPRRPRGAGSDAASPASDAARTRVARGGALALAARDRLRAPRRTAGPRCASAVTPLRPGRYRLRAIARDASRNRAKAKRAAFRVVRH